MTDGNLLDRCSRRWRGGDWCRVVLDRAVGGAGAMVFAVIGAAGDQDSGEGGHRDGSQGRSSGDGLRRSREHHGDCHGQLEADPETQVVRRPKAHAVSVRAGGLRKR